MPKVTRKETSQPLQEVSAMVVDDEALPVKPNFSALSAQEQQKGKVEFRRVGSRQGFLQTKRFSQSACLDCAGGITGGITCVSKGACRLPQAARILQVLLQLLLRSTAAGSSPGTCPHLNVLTALINGCCTFCCRYLCHKTG